MATTKKSTKEMIVIAKYTVKRSGAVIYRMRSNQPNKLGRIEGRDQEERNGLYYDAYMVSSDGKTVCGCQTSGEQCPGSKYRGTCCHRKHAQKLLDTFNASKPVEQSTVQETAKTAKSDSEKLARYLAAQSVDLGTYGQLSSTQGFSLLR